MKKFFKLLIGLALLPLCWAGSRTFFFLLVSASPQAAVGWALPTGFFVSVLGFFLLPKAFRTYVLGHELSHALAGLLMGAKIGKMKIGREGGHVELSKSNFIIALAPYFFPFYTGLVIALWFGIGFFRDVSAFEPLWLGLVGLTWGFHVTFTLYMLSQHQPDVQENGRIFSYVVIYLVNLFVVALWIILLGEMTFSGSWNILCNETVLVYSAVASAVLTGWASLTELFFEKKQGSMQ
ncbi:hypothetical protein [Tichowtungia aerotolerans]|uniref:Uncharacterized protein n=1 Tax=Tichowtungia aerotolerans TaxID=2697043 RepID=A0A6P1MC03_9BACT|nr:hypothetical protein [Tichowtungia aerotolerans]QHI70633.1 hypothetical protein GT409_14685 [Tichowtungia aerotolerans]